MMGKDKGPLGSGKGRELNAEVARICLALHRARPFTHLAATDGGRDMPNKWVGDRFVPRPVVSYGVYEGPARFGRPVEGSDGDFRPSDGGGYVAYKKADYAHALSRSDTDVQMYLFETFGGWCNAIKRLFYQMKNKK